MRIGGVSSKDNTADVLTKTLQPPQHAKHCTHLHILQPTMTSHVITIQNHSVFTFASPTPQSHKQQKRKARKQRQRERNYRLIAHARSTLKQQHHLDNNETTNIHTFLSTLQERQLHSRTHKSPPPKSSTRTQRAHPRQEHPIPRPTANHPSHTTKKRRTRNKSRLHLAHTPKSYDPNSNPCWKPKNDRKDKDRPRDDLDKTTTEKFSNTSC